MRVPEFHWSTANAKDRGEMVRQHRKISADEVCRLFNLTPEGYAAILRGADWHPSYSNE